jgi:hypothetical protein
LKVRAQRLPLWLVTVSGLSWARVVDALTGTIPARASFFMSTRDRTQGQNLDPSRRHWRLNDSRVFLEAYRDQKVTRNWTLDLRRNGIGLESNPLCSLDFRRSQAHLDESLARARIVRTYPPRGEARGAVPAEGMYGECSVHDVLLPPRRAARGATTSPFMPSACAPAWSPGATAAR